MALRPQPLTNAAEAVKYYAAQFADTKTRVRRNGVSSDYYLKEQAVWYGKLPERLGLSREVSKEDFVALMNNERPGTDGERLTMRQNTTRTKLVWELDEESQSRIQVEKEVSNRRVAVDWVFSLEKDKSVYLAKTKDRRAESLVHQALEEQLDALQADTKTRVRGNGADTDRITGEAAFCVVIHRVARPVDGVSDPHWHAHCVMPNVTWDEVEQQYKAANITFENKAYREALFHARVNELWMAEGIGFRRTDKGLDMSIFQPKEIRTFCKRTAEVEKFEEQKGTELQRKTTAKVKAAAKRGEVLEYDYEYRKLKDKLGERSRKGKDTATTDGQALEAEWAKQMEPGRWDAITPETARNGDRIDFLDAETAKTMAIQHAFEQKSVIRDADLFKTITQFGCGTMSVTEMERFCQEDARLVRNPEKPGMVTTHAIIAEEQKIRELVRFGKNIREQPITKGKPWKPRDKQLDEGQLAAVKLVLENRDLAIAVPGYTGAGKSRTVKEAALAVKTLTGLEPVIMAPGGRAAGKLAEAAGASESYTLAKFKESEKLQVDAKGRQIFIDEFSHINNEDAWWMLDFARANGNQIVFWGDGAQYLGVSRGDPVSDLLKAGLLNYAQLTEIYRQKENPELLSAVLAAAENRYQESVDQVKAAGWMHVEDNEDELRKAIVAAMAEKLAKDQPVMAIALQHKHGEAIARDVRARLKETGYLGKEDHEVKWLKEVHLSEAQRGDAINFEAGQTVKFHRLSQGGFKSGEAWAVARVEDGRVIVRKAGQEKALPLSNAKDFQVYESGVMELAAGDRLLMTKNNAKANVRTGDIRKIKSIDARSVTLDNGKTLDISEGLHARQGYTVTGLVSQGDQAAACFPFFPTSAAGQINQRTWLVSISRAQTELKVFTDCPELLEQRAVMPEDRDSALSLVDASPLLVKASPPAPTPPAPPVEQSREVDLQEGKHFTRGKTLKEEIAAASVIGDVDLFKTIAQFTYGTMSVKEMDRFRLEVARLVRDFNYAELIEIYQQEKDNPKVLCAVLVATEKRYRESLNKVEEKRSMGIEDEEEKQRARGIHAMMEKFIKGAPASPPAPTPQAPPVEQSREIDLQAGKRAAPGKTLEEIVAAMKKGAAPGAVGQQQKAAEFMRQWQQTHGQSQDRERGIER